MKQVAASALELLSLKPGHRVLEVGCGNGVFLPALAHAVGATGQVFGIDHSETFVAEALAKIAGTPLVANVFARHGDAYRLPFADSSFDAAHCERVLMHLDNPNAALAEMRRVVRPGGWIVAAEPDWGGIRIDHADRAGMDLLYSRAHRIRQLDMGLTLYRRMGEVGLEERRALPAMVLITDYGVLKGYGFDLTPAADAAVADALLTRGHADALLAELEAADLAGRYFAAGLTHVVGGRVPT